MDNPEKEKPYSNLADLDVELLEKEPPNTFEIELSSAANGYDMTLSPTLGIRQICLNLWKRNKAQLLPFDYYTTRALPKGFSGSRQCLKTEKC